MRIVRCNEEPCPGAIRQGNSIIWLVVDSDAELDPSADVLTAAAAVAAAPRRTDLEPTHPLYNQRALSAVPAGSRDIVVDDDGNLTPFGGE